MYTTGTLHMGCTLHRGIIIKNLYSTLLVQYIQDAQGKQAEHFKALNCNLYKANNFKWSSHPNTKKI